MASASVTATSVADLAITKTDGLDTVFAGNTVTYTITVSNRGPSDVVGAAVNDTFPPALSNVSWSCLSGTGSSCSSASGTGNIATTVSLPRGGSVTFTATATVSPTAERRSHEHRHGRAAGRDDGSRPIQQHLDRHDDDRRVGRPDHEQVGPSERHASRHRWSSPST